MRCGKHEYIMKNEDSGTICDIFNSKWALFTGKKLHDIKYDEFRNSGIHVL